MAQFSLTNSPLEQRLMKQDLGIVKVTVSTYLVRNYWGVFPVEVIKVVEIYLHGEDESEISTI
jgi:hypothetical protein